MESEWCGQHLRNVACRCADLVALLQPYPQLVERWIAASRTPEVLMECIAHPDIAEPLLCHVIDLGLSEGLLPAGCVGASRLGPVLRRSCYDAAAALIAAGVCSTAALAAAQTDVLSLAAGRSHLTPEPLNCGSLAHVLAAGGSLPALAVLLDADGAVPQHTRHGLLCHAFRAAAEPVSLALVSRVGRDPATGALSCDAAGTWPSGTRLTALHWACALPWGGRLLRELLSIAAVDVNVHAEVSSRAGLGAGASSATAVEALSPLAPGEGVTEAVHPLVLCFVPLSSRLGAACSAMDSLQKATDLLNDRRVELTAPVAEVCLRWCLRRRLWEDGAAVPVMRRLFSALPVGARVPLHCALPPVCLPPAPPPPPAEVEESSRFAAQLLDSFPRQFDVDAMSGEGLSPVHICCVLDTPALLSALLSDAAGSAANPAQRATAPAACEGSILSVAAHFSGEETLAVVLRHSGAGGRAALLTPSPRTLETPLHAMLRRFKLDAAAAALSAGAPTTARDGVGRTPLHSLLYALEQELGEAPQQEGSRLAAVCDDWLAAACSADPSCGRLRDADGTGVVHLAVACGCAKTVKAVVAATSAAAEAAVLGPSGVGKSLAHFAARSVIPQAADALAEVPRRAVEWCAPDSEGVPPLHAALRRPSCPLAVATAILVQVALPALCPRGRTAWHTAAAGSVPPTLLQLPPQHARAVCTAVDSAGCTVVHAACEQGNLPLLRAAVTALGADASAALLSAAHCGDTALHMLLRCAAGSAAAEAAQLTEAVEVMTAALPAKERARLLRVRAADGHTFLHLASAAGAGGLCETVRMWLRTAARGGPDEYVRQLRARDSSGVRCCDASLAAGQPALAWAQWTAVPSPRDAEPRCGDGRSLLLCVCADSRQPPALVAEVAAGAEHGVDLLATDDKGRGALLLCCMGAVDGDPAVAEHKLLCCLKMWAALPTESLAAPAAAEVAGEGGCYGTPVHAAATLGMPRGLAALLRLGASPDGSGQTSAPLCCALKHRRDSCVAVLLGHGVDLRARDCAGRSALHIAAEHCPAATVCELLRHGAPGAATPGPDGLTPVRVIGTGKRRVQDSPAELCYLFSALSEAAAADGWDVAEGLSAALAGWYRSAESGGDVCSSSNSLLSLPPAAFCQAVAREAGETVGPGLSQALPQYFAVVTASHFLRRTPDDGSWQVAAAEGVPGLEDVPWVLRRQWPAWALLALMLDGTQQDVEWALRIALADADRAAVALPALFYFPEGWRAAATALRMDRTRAAATALQAERASPVLQVICRAARVWDISLRHGGRVEQLLVAATFCGDLRKARFHRSLLAGRHLGSDDLITAVLDYRPEIDAALVADLDSRGLLEHKNAHGDTILHLVVMCDCCEALAAIPVAKVDVCARNAAGLHAVDYCRSAEMLRLLMAAGAVPPVTEVADQLYCVVTDERVLETPPLIGTQMLQNWVRSVSAPVLRALGASEETARPALAARAAALERLATQLLEQRFIVHESPAPFRGLLALSLPRRRLYELVTSRDGGAGSGTDSDSDSDAERVTAVRDGDFMSALRSEVAVKVRTELDGLRLTRVRRLKMARAALNPFVSSMKDGRYVDALKIELTKMQKQGHVAAVFPVHYQPAEPPVEDTELFSAVVGIHKRLLQWATSAGEGEDKFPVLTKLRRRCGESVTYYFAFLLLYQAWTVLLAPFAVALFVAQSTVGFDDVIAYGSANAALVVLWGGGLAKGWKRKEAAIGAHWRVYARPRSACPRPSFEPLPQPGEDPPWCTVPSTFDPSRREPHYPPSARTALYAQHLLVVAVALFACFAEFVVFVVARLNIQRPSSGCGALDIACLLQPVPTTPPAAVLNGTAADPPDDSEVVADNGALLVMLTLVHTLLMHLLEAVYRVISDRLTERENHKFHFNFVASLTLKYMALQLLNAMLPPLFIVFAESNTFGASKAFQNCSLHLYTKLLVELFWGYSRDQFLPRIRSSLERRRERYGAKAPPVWAVLWGLAHERRYERFDTEPQLDLFPEFAELMVQLSFILCFSTVSPLVVPIVIVNNVLETRCDLLTVMRREPRPFPQRARGIGVWSVIPRMLAVLGAVVSAGVVNFASDHASGRLHDGTGNGRLVGFLSCVVCAIGSLWLINAAVPSAPRWAEQEMKAQHMLRDSDNRVRQVFRKAVRRIASGGATSRPAHGSTEPASAPHQPPTGGSESSPYPRRQTALSQLAQPRGGW
eukprot:TRINITY_DN1591_c0_g2_i2.p1 TRINITY_DN1591_c0_g2~~TRINITY_DN1591_c0_g2_i2.p1  ORF type:complete len:2221 (+),score=708.43 TRINITY_DN1591_c0_g2_i2:76-6738(+)